MKRFLRSALIFWGIVAFFPLGYLIFSYLQNSLPMLKPLADSNVSIAVWSDTNANGIRDRGEKPLSDVCVGYTYSSEALLQGSCDYAVTDESGSWWEFMPGEDCSGGIYIYALAPKGFLPTTDMVVEGCAGDFGFTQKDMEITHKVVTITEFARQKAVIKWITRTAIALMILGIAAAGTIWLEKPHKAREIKQHV